ncbi:hypothetical protein THAOC_25563, partial [Thalassiosira oceanica]
ARAGVERHVEGFDSTWHLVAPTYTTLGRQPEPSRAEEPGFGSEATVRNMAAYVKGDGGRRAGGQKSQLARGEAGQDQDGGATL